MRNPFVIGAASIFLILAFVAPLFAVSPGSTLRIVKDELLENGNFYFVKGSIYNPNNRAVKNVVIKYYIWKKWMGKDGHGTVVKENGGLVSASIKYLPPKQTVEFIATGDNSAPVMAQDVPDPLDAKIIAEWEQ